MHNGGSAFQKKHFLHRFPPVRKYGNSITPSNRHSVLGLRIIMEFRFKAAACIRLCMHFIIHAFDYTCMLLCMYLIVYAYGYTCISPCLYLTQHAFDHTCIRLYMQVVGQRSCVIGHTTCVTAYTSLSIGNLSQIMDHTLYIIGHRSQAIGHR